jgi:hypothetical protein
VNSPEKTTLTVIRETQNLSRRFDFSCIAIDIRDSTSSGSGIGQALLVRVLGLQRGFNDCKPISPVDKGDLMEKLVNFARLSEIRLQLSDRSRFFHQYRLQHPFDGGEVLVRYTGQIAFAAVFKQLIFGK